MKKIEKEWTIDAKWGKIAMVSWGNPANPPILLLHGYMDTAATFMLLVDQLPDDYYYVAFDLPGHGKSDPFPPGVVVSKINMVEPIRLIVKYMKWEKFAFMAHSMGFVIGIVYNHIFPGTITKMVHLDPAVAIASYYYPHYKLSVWQQYLYDMYYNNYESFITGPNKTLTLEEAVGLSVRNRNITEDQAEIILSRSLIPAGDGRFRLSWEPRMKKIATIPISEETFFTIITENAPPTLIIEASDGVNTNERAKQFALKVLENCRSILPNFYSVTVVGGHDVHITNSEGVAPHVEKFLRSPETFSNDTVKSKL
ncbi:unnamed protein product [Spodoptera littoralis]|uniref:AB hydrolase-1 domain-containing protein n=1 Tax=Spodoptera littoralis TaxID=7109 RepID=A0A9P0IA17_SPOLI|nr:unnamed protein product [Spodoptera littoralis]CAH1642105.1 unnamed protein product [Spodoptera littoralis]